MEYLEIKHTCAVTFFLLVGLTQVSYGQTKGMETMVDGLVEEMPASSPQALYHLTKDLEETGGPGIKHLLGSLGDGMTDDSKVRQAISAMSKQASDEGSPTLEKAFLAALQDVQMPMQAKDFLLGQMQFFGSDASVMGLAELIPQLCYPVVRTLSAIGSEKALDALAGSSKDVSDDCRAAVITALATHQSSRALPMAEEYLQSEHQGLQAAVRAALLVTPTSDSYELLIDRSKQGSEADQLALLAWLDDAAARGKKENLRKNIGAVLKAESSDQVKLCAMQVAARHLGNGATPLMKRSLQAASPELATSLVGVLNNNLALPLMPYFGMVKAIPLPGRVALAGVAAKRKDSAGLPLARKLIAQDFGIDARIAGIKALSQIAGKTALPELLQMLKKSSDLMEVAALMPQISRYLGAEEVPLLAEILPSAGHAGQLGILRLVKDRSLAGLFPEILPLLDADNEEVRAAAFQTLPALSGAITLDELVPVFSKAEGEEEQVEVASAVAKFYDVEEQRTALIARLIQLYPDPTATPIVARALAKTGDQSALRFIEQRILTTGGYPNHAQEALLEWDHRDAISLLFDQLKDSDEMVKTAAAGRIITLSGQHKSAQQLLILRKLMERDIAEKTAEDALREVARVAEISNLRYLAGFLEYPALKKTAADGIVRIALNLDAPDDFLGKEELSLIKEARQVLGDDIGYYTIDALQALLDNTSENGGYTSLFNGVDLGNWQGVVGSPLSRAKMTLQDRIRAQDSADYLMRDSWIVRDGLLKFIGSGYDNLCTTVESYQDFELILDWKIEKDGDSGIYLKGSPQVQIWDPGSENAGVGSGGLFNNKLNASTPLVHADNAVGEWNNFRILMIDDRVTVYLNGELVTDHEVLENYWDREKKLFPKGPIELQAHTTPLAFRDLYIRELSGAFQPQPLEQRDSFVALYNGINLDGWIGNKSDYVSENGEIVIQPTLSGGSGNLFTEKEYENFVLRFEFRLTPGANNGLGIHAPTEGDAAYLGKEVQILDNTAEKYALLKEYQYHGSVYGVVAAKRGFLKPVGEWNQEEVIVKGDLFVVRLNGETILEANLAEASKNGTLDGKDHPGLMKKKGHIGFLGHGSEVRFRNIRIRELNSALQKE